MMGCEYEETDCRSRRKREGGHQISDVDQKMLALVSAASSSWAAVAARPALHMAPRTLTVRMQFASSIPQNLPDHLQDMAEEQRAQANPAQLAQQRKFANKLAKFKKIESAAAEPASRHTEGRHQRTRDRDSRVGSVSAAAAPPKRVGGVIYATECREVFRDP